MPIVVCQRWEESERGFGCRPDGYSLHKTEEDRLLYIKEYWRGMPDETPDVYSRPSGEPYLIYLDTQSQEWFRLVKCNYGISCYGNPPKV